MFEVIKQGLETSVQDYPGRVGYLNQGFPPSGPMDSWSFRLANLLGKNTHVYIIEISIFYIPSFCSKLLLCNSRPNNKCAA